MVPYRRGGECSSRWVPRQRGQGGRGRPRARRTGSGIHSIGRWSRRRALCAPRLAPSTGSPASSCTPLQEQADTVISSGPSRPQLVNKARRAGDEGSRYRGGGLAAGRRRTRSGARRTAPWEWTTRRRRRMTRRRRRRGRRRGSGGRRRGPEAASGGTQPLGGLALCDCVACLATSVAGEWPRAVASPRGPAG